MQKFYKNYNIVTNYNETLTCCEEETIEDVWNLVEKSFDFSRSTKLVKFIKENKSLPKKFDLAEKINSKKKLPLWFTQEEVILFLTKEEKLSLLFLIQELEDKYFKPISYSYNKIIEFWNGKKKDCYFWHKINSLLFRFIYASYTIFDKEKFFFHLKLEILTSKEGVYCKEKQCIVPNHSDYNVNVSKYILDKHLDSVENFIEIKEYINSMGLQYDSKLLASLNLILESMMLDKTVTIDILPLYNKLIKSIILNFLKMELNNENTNENNTI